MSLQHANYGSGQLGRPRQKTGLSRPRRATQHTRLRAPVDASEVDDGFFNTGLHLQEASPLAVRSWLAFQLLSLVLQWQFWQEVRTNLDLFDETLAIHCAPDASRHGVCVGPIWNISAWHEFVLHGKPSRIWHTELPPSVHMRTHTHNIDSVSSIDAEIAQLEQETAARVKQLRERRTELEVLQGLAPVGLNRSVTGRAFNSTYVFEFETRSSPPVFLLSLNPVARAHRAGETPPTVNPAHDVDGGETWPWSVQLRRVEPAQATSDYQRFGSGEKVLAIEDQSIEAASSMRTLGHIRWEAMVQNTDFSPKQTRFVAFVEDFQAPHLDAIYANSQCSLTKAWKAFNKQHQGHHHNALLWCRSLLGYLLPVGMLATSAVYLHARRAQQDSEQPDDVELVKAAPANDGCSCCGGYEFQAIILLKLLVMDVPQQVCIVLYLLGWYELEGLRCQLCLFHPEHCEPQHPFRLANSVEELKTRCASSDQVANQMIIGPKQKHKTSSEPGAEWIVRTGTVCVSILPFTTGVYWSTSALLWTPVLARILFFLPCVIGWFFVFASVMSCLVLCCAEL